MQKKMPLSPRALKALTSSALVLPGLLVASANAQAAEGDEVDFQYSHYQEGSRDIYGDNRIPNSDPQVPGSDVYGKTPSKLAPIEVDSLHGHARVSLTDRVKFAFNYLQDTWSGATPLATAPAQTGVNRNSYYQQGSGLLMAGASPITEGLASFYLDQKGHISLPDFDKLDPITGQPLPSNHTYNQITHVMSYASPETRKQGDFRLSYDWDDASANFGGGISTEDDYESRFVNLGTRLDFNQKQTSLNLGLSYTNSDTHALLDPDQLGFVDTNAYDNSYVDPTLQDANGQPINRVLPQQPTVTSGEVESTYDLTRPASTAKRSATLRGNRQDIGGELGISQVLGKNTIMSLGMAYTHSSGYLGNPYKLVYVFDASPSSNQDPAQPILFNGTARLETRPAERNQFNWNLGVNQFIEPLDAALHFDYRFAHDDWGINAHTFESDWVQPVGAGWTLTPRIRYYSQSKAFFYAPFFTTVQVQDATTFEPVDSPMNRSLPNFYSSDQRLSGFGTLSGGITVAKDFAKGIGLEAGFEYYTHQGGLKIGGGGEGKFADYDYWVANAAIKLNLDALSLHSNSLNHSYGQHDEHPAHHHDTLPAGVMFGHTLERAGDFMVGYRYMRSDQAGGMLNGSQKVDQNTTFANGCGDQTCTVLPNAMTMNMHMLDLMYAPVDWLTLMLMPQWMDMEMNMTHAESAAVGHHASIASVTKHQVGGVGDTGVYALFKLFDQPHHHLNLSLGGTAPTGDVDVKLRKTSHNPSYDTPIHYGMQLGSGTWDFKPSLTYTGEMDHFSWGAQITGTKRLEKRNANHFVFGDIFQGSMWGGISWTDWLATTVRGIYTRQGAVRGQYAEVLTTEGVPLVSSHVGPFDSPAYYGGEFVDLGLGVNVNIPSGVFVGNSFKFEWLQPINTHYHGYQLDRDYALNFTWSYGF